MLSIINAKCANLCIDRGSSMKWKHSYTHIHITAFVLLTFAYNLVNICDLSSFAMLKNHQSDKNTHLKNDNS